MTLTLPVSEVKMKLTHLIEQVQGQADEIVVTRRGKPAAIILSYEEYEGLKETLEIMSQPKLVAELKRRLGYFRRGGKGLTLEQIFGDE
ncbi:MAG: type II toxin-antitoxin system Phd/YefM family antitoxin [Candidatus Omnitrophica bacterium]|nr:type II toxin-antitoxin system Phd/YefM family antitoxin [Candidatus Omnitrophota bacterium]